MQVDASGVGAGTINGRRQRNTMVGQAGRGFEGFQRMAGKTFNRGFRVHQLVHKRTVGAVFQQAPYQVGQQILMATYRRINAYGLAWVFFQHGVIEFVTHTPQALVFKGPALGQGLDGHHGLGIV